MPIALVTGASSGLGVEFVDAAIDTAPDIDEIWIIARRRDRLEHIVAAHPGIRMRSLALDLTCGKDLEHLRAILDEENPQISLLVNCAGVLHSGAFRDLAPAQLRSQILLNTAAPVDVCHACIPHMTNASTIINVGSISGFAPVQNQVVYAASKSFLYEFSLGLRAELAPSGIQVLVMTPGNMLTEMNTGPEGHGISDRLPFLDLPTITREAIRRARNGHATYTPHRVYKTYHALTKILPHQLIARLANR